MVEMLLGHSFRTSITHSATPHLDGRYTRFGEVVEGMDIVWQLQVGDLMERVERID